MSRSDVILWVIVPYATLAVFVVGHVWRWRTDQFGWTTRSTQLLESRWLTIGSNLFHVGALLAIVGHIVGMIFPESLTERFGMSEHMYHVQAVGVGSFAGFLCIAGLVILVVRRLSVPRVAATTSTADLVMYAVITVAIVTGQIATAGYQVLTDGYNYRETIAPYMRGLMVFDPRPSHISGAPVLYQVHVLSTFALYALWPFTRLVHVWSVPWRYLIRRPQVVRARRGTVRDGARSR